MVNKKIQEMAFEAVEHAKTSGKIKKGANEATKAAEKGTAKLILIAKDTNPKEIVMHIGPLCKEKNIPFVEVDRKDELGTAAGIPVSTTAVAVIQEGDAKAKIKRVVEALKSEGQKTTE